MKRFLSFLFLVFLVLSLTACGTDPNVTAFKEKLTASDWTLSFMGMNGITFRFNEDDTGQMSTDLNDGTIADIKYTVSDATDGGESAIISFTPAEVDGKNFKKTSDNESDWYTKFKAEFVPGGLRVTNIDNPEAKSLVLKPVTKN